MFSFVGLIRKTIVLGKQNFSIRQYFAENSYLKETWKQLGEKYSRNLLVPDVLFCFPWYERGT